MQKFNVIGIDLAKNVMQVCKIDKNGELHSNKAMSPNKLKELLAKPIASIVAMEGCGGCCCNGRLWCLLLLGEISQRAWSRRKNH